MASMTFMINAGSTNTVAEDHPDVWVTVTEQPDGTLKFEVRVTGDYIGDLRGLFFDVNEQLLGSLSITPDSVVDAYGDDSIDSVGSSSNNLGGVPTDGYDVGVEIGLQGIAGGDDFQYFTFTLDSSSRDLTLQDIDSEQFAVRLMSVGYVDGNRSTSDKLWDMSPVAYDAKDDVLECVDEDTNVAGNVFANDTPVARGTYTVTAVNGSATSVGATIALEGTEGATLLLNSDGSYVIDATASDALSAGEHIDVEVSYDGLNTFTDGSATDSAVLSFQICGLNDGPTAVDDASLGCVAENSAVTGGNVLANDSDIDRLDSISLVRWQGGTLGSSLLIAGAEGASVVLNSSGSWTVDASTADALGAGEHVTASYTYTIADNNGAEATASFAVEVCGANDGPVGNDDAPACVEENTQASGNVLINDTDVDRNDQGLLTVASWSGGTLGSTVAIANGAGATVTLRGDGGWTVDASSADALGASEEISQTFSYTVADAHGGSDTASFTVEVCGVNDGPVAKDDAAGCIDEGQKITASVTGNDSDIDRGDTHTWALIESSFDGLGTLTFNANGTWSYDAAGAYNYLNEGDDVELSFQYRMTDASGAFDDATVSFCVQGVGGGSDHFPNQPKDISNIVLYFNDDAAITGDARGAWLTQTMKNGSTKVTATADGVYTVKMDVPGSFSDDLDETISSILSYVEANGLDPDAELVGVAVKGGNVAHGGYHNFYAMDGDADAEFTWGGDSTILADLTGRTTLALDNEIDATIAYSSVFPG